MQVRDKEQFRNTICNMQIKHVAQLRKVSRVEALRSLSKVERFPRLVLGGISFPRHTYALNYERTCLSARLKHLESIVHKKKARNSPEMNAIPYLVYKKCPALLALLVILFARVWKEKRVPQQWQWAIIILQ